MASEHPSADAVDGAPPSGMPVRNRFYGLVRSWSVPLLRLYFGLRTEGADNVPGRGALIVAANHGSYVDPAVLGSACPRVLHFLMDSAIFGRLGFSWFFRGMGAVPVDRNRSGGNAGAVVRRALSLLRQGHAVGVFPAGTRLPADAGGDGQGGVALMSRRARVPVLPVGIAGAEAAMPPGSPVPWPRRVVVRFGRPLVHPGSGSRSRAGDRAFTREVMAAIDGLARAGVPEEGVPVATGRA